MFYIEVIYNQNTQKQVFKADIPSTDPKKDIAAIKKQLIMLPFVDFGEWTIRTDSLASFRVFHSENEVVLDLENAEHLEVNTNNPSREAAVKRFLEIFPDGMVFDYTTYGGFEVGKRVKHYNTIELDWIIVAFGRSSPTQDMSAILINRKGDYEGHLGLNNESVRPE